MDIRDRLNTITAHYQRGRGRFQRLATTSGIGLDSWKNTWHNKQRPTADMIQFVAQAWPQHAFWLVTGIIDPKHEHVAPPTLKEPPDAEGHSSSDEPLALCTIVSGDHTNEANPPPGCPEPPPGVPTTSPHAPWALVVPMSNAQATKLQQLATRFAERSGCPVDAAAWLRWQIDMATPPAAESR